MMCLDFANYFAAHHGKVLYCAIEEGFGYTLKEKIQRLGAQHPKLFIADLKFFRILILYSLILFQSQEWM